LSHDCRGMDTPGLRQEPVGYIHDIRLGDISELSTKVRRHYVVIAIVKDDESKCEKRGTTLLCVQRWAVFEILVFQIRILNTFLFGIWYLKYCKLSILYFGILNTFLSVDVFVQILYSKYFSKYFQHTFNMREKTFGY